MTKPMLLPTISQRSGIIVLTSVLVTFSAAAMPAKMKAITPSGVASVAVAVVRARSISSEAYMSKQRRALGDCTGPLGPAATVCPRVARPAIVIAQASGDPCGSDGRGYSRLRLDDSMSQLRRGKPAEVQVVRLLRYPAGSRPRSARARGAQDGDHRLQRPQGLHRARRAPRLRGAARGEGALLQRDGGRDQAPRRQDREVH